MLKIEADLRTNKNPAITRIANELISRSKKDKLLEPILDKKNKSLSQMYEYIKKEVRKMEPNSKSMIMVDDDTVFGWAQHYYDEDEIGMVDKKEKDSKTVIADLPEETEDSFDF